MDLQQIGLRHPRIRQVRNVLANRAPHHRHFFVAEGLWAHDVLLDLDAAIELFLWCPEAAYAEQAHARSARLAARATAAYRISPKVLEHLTERDRPDGLVSLVSLPRCDSAMDFPARTALVVGNERYGIARPWREHGFAEVAVPMFGVADSLNVSVCASIVLYEARGRQDRLAARPAT